MRRTLAPGNAFTAIPGRRSSLRVNPRLFPSAGISSSSRRNTDDVFYRRVRAHRDRPLVSVSSRMPAWRFQNGLTKGYPRSYRSYARAARVNTWSTSPRSPSRRETLGRRSQPLLRRTRGRYCSVFPTTAGFSVSRRRRAPQIGTRFSVGLKGSAPAPSDRPLHRSHDLHWKRDELSL